MKQVIFLILLLTYLISCSSVRVNYDYDNTTDFSSYTTYSYFDDMETGMSQLDERRLMNAMDIVLRAKGLMFSEEPDIFINIKSSVFRSQSGNSVGVGLGGGGGAVGGGVSMGVPVGGAKLKREIQLDFVDAKKDMLVWQAISESAFEEGLSPEIAIQKMEELVAKVFEKYPPKLRK